MWSVLLLENYLSNRHQRVVLNGQISKWAYIQAGVPQGSVLGPLLFLIYINDLPDGLKSIAKLFANDTSLFSVVKDVTKSCFDLNCDLSKINDWAYQCFNPDPNKQATEVIFSHKTSHQLHPPIYFNNTTVVSQPSTKHLGMILDSKLNFSQHLSEKISKANKGIGLIKRLRYNLSRKHLVTIYKSNIRPHLDYGDIIYDQPHIDTFVNKIEPVQYFFFFFFFLYIHTSNLQKRKRLYKTQYPTIEHPNGGVLHTKILKTQKNISRTDRKKE